MGIATKADMQSIIIILFLFPLTLLFIKNNEKSMATATPNSAERLAAITALIAERKNNTINIFELLFL